jgi:hypothetical protein
LTLFGITNFFAYLIFAIFFCRSSFAFLFYLHTSFFSIPHFCIPSITFFCRFCIPLGWVFLFFSYHTSFFCMSTSFFCLPHFLHTSQFFAYLTFLQCIPHLSAYLFFCILILFFCIYLIFWHIHLIFLHTSFLHTHFSTDLLLHTLGVGLGLGFSAYLIFLNTYFFSIEIPHFCIPHFLHTFFCIP